MCEREDHTQVILKITVIYVLHGKACLRLWFDKIFGSHDFFFAITTNKTGCPLPRKMNAGQWGKEILSKKKEVSL